MMLLFKFLSALRDRKNWTYDWLFLQCGNLRSTFQKNSGSENGSPIIFKKKDFGEYFPSWGFQKCFPRCKSFWVVQTGIFSMCVIGVFDSILWLLPEEMWMAPKDNDNLLVVGKVLADVCVITGEQDAVSALKEKRASLLKEIEVASLLDQIHELKQSLKEAETNLKLLEASGQDEKGEVDEPKAKKLKGDDDAFETPEKPSKDKQLGNKENQEKPAMKPWWSGQLEALMNFQGSLFNRWIAGGLVEFPGLSLQQMDCWRPWWISRALFNWIFWPVFYWSHSLSQANFESKLFSAGRTKERL